MNKQRSISLREVLALKSNDITANSYFLGKKLFPKNEKQTKLTNCYHSTSTANPNNEWVPENPQIIFICR